jgi:hypothetical protein
MSVNRLSGLDDTERPNCGEDEHRPGITQKRANGLAERYAQCE